MCYKPTDSSHVTIVDDHTRRDILRFMAFLPLVSFSREYVFAEVPQENRTGMYPTTMAVLESAYHIEMIAHLNYVGFSERAIKENYRNIAYLFASFSVSERIHAENFKKILSNFTSLPEEPRVNATIEETKANLQTAAKRELEKINETYPEFLRELEAESHDEAVIKCMWAWKSHRQHEDKIEEVFKYAGYFFSAVAEKIESMNYDFHVCKICGSTIDEKPEFPCEICNYPASNYMSIPRSF